MAEPGQPKRLTEIPKCLPVLFVICVIASLYMIFIFWHCVPQLQLEKDPHTRDAEAVTRGTTHLILFLILSSLLNVCYIQSILTDPGQIPADKEWNYYGDVAVENKPASAFETKRTGERRNCKWCNKYKPDRCHHCRVCRTCVLKMDHHCPWIYNCVGFKNHKFFFLLLFYTFCCTQLIFWTMFPSMKQALEEDHDFYNMFILLFGETLSGFLGILVTAFWCFHIWLTLKSMSTIEFCEKSMKKVGYSSSIYDRGIYGNLQEVLGRNPLFWLLPIADYIGDGLTFPITKRDEPRERLIEEPREPTIGGANRRSREPVADADDVLAPPLGTGALAR
jgi:hypothetical protein